MTSSDNQTDTEEEVIPLRTFTRLSGQELASLRRAAGMTQVQLARAAGIGRQAVGYWERKPLVSPRGWAPRRMFDVLGIRVVHGSRTSTRGRARARDGVLSELDRHVAELIAREEARITAKVKVRQVRLGVRAKSAARSVDCSTRKDLADDLSAEVLRRAAVSADQSSRAVRRPSEVL